MMRSTSFHLAALALVSLNVGTASARDRGEQSAPPPKEYRDLMSCRGIVDSTTRLTCFDSRASALDTATQSHEVVIADRQAVASARRGLFGFTAPVGKLLGFGADDEGQLKQIESKVARVSHTGDGAWKLFLEDGSTWEQNDTRGFVLSPRVGNAVVIKRGALGSYFVAVESQRAVKMRRVQ
jgi:hypothetical protein